LNIAHSEKVARLGTFGYRNYIPALDVLKIRRKLGDGHIHKTED
jgi:hypothetical protein